MDRAQLIACFEDSQRYIWQTLAEDTQATQRGTRLYSPGFRAQARRQKSIDAPIEVMEDTTFHCAMVHGSGRTAVLNFANAYRPGGGVTTGAMAQEECLCRSSNLYNALTIPEMMGGYYHWNAAHTDFIGTDAVIYSPDVVVFKSDDALPVMLIQPFRVDVLTSAAPELFRSRTQPSTEQLAEIYDRRIRNILEVAVEHDVDTLILGAFGCGAFANPPEQVAAAFRRLLVGEGYRDCFRRVIFAIKRNNIKNTNLEAFQECFGVL